MHKVACHLILFGLILIITGFFQDQDFTFLDVILCQDRILLFRNGPRRPGPGDSPACRRWSYLSIGTESVYATPRHSSNLEWTVLQFRHPCQSWLAQQRKRHWTASPLTGWNIELRGTTWTRVTSDPLSIQWSLGRLAHPSTMAVTSSSSVMSSSTRT